MMDKDKYFNLIDFSFSVDYSNRNSKDFICHTSPSYTPPEIILRSDYEYSSDYYRLGNIIFYLIFKRFPLNIKRKQNLTEYVLENYPKNFYSDNLLDLINQLIEPDKTKRLGFKDFNEIMNHPFFHKLNWKKLERKKIISPLNYKGIIFYDTKCKKFNKTKRDSYIYSKLIITKYNDKYFKAFEYSKYKK